MSERANIQRPILLAATLGVLLAASSALGMGLYELSARRAAAPDVMAVEKAVLAQALEESPWISSDDGEGGGPVVWIVTAPKCPDCREMEKRVLPALLAQGAEVRVIPVATRKQAGLEAKTVAALVRRREWEPLDAWMKGGGDKTGVRMEPAATEGYLEWGRASYDRIARAVRRNGEEMRVPALFWQDGPEWRASIAPDGRAAEAVKRQVKAASWQRPD